jgi:hypothetical protein
MIQRLAAMQLASESRSGGSFYIRLALVMTIRTNSAGR